MMAYDIQQIRLPEQSYPNVVTGAYRDTENALEMAIQWSVILERDDRAAPHPEPAVTKAVFVGTRLVIHDGSGGTYTKEIPAWRVPSLPAA